MGDDNEDLTASKKLIQLSSSTSWEDIPDQLWDIVFAAVVHDGNHRRLEPISLVCKRFLTLSNNHFTSLTISPSKSPEQFYSRFPFINTIELSWADPNLDATITQLAHSNLLLQSLHLSEQTHFPKEAMPLLGQRMGKTLTSLSCVQFENLDDADLGVVADCFPYLQKLNIKCHFDGGQVTDEGIRAISIKLKLLVSLDISLHDHLSQRSIEYLSSNCLLLRDLTAFANNFDFGLDQFISFSSLSSLVLESVIISERILDQLSKANLKLRILVLPCAECSNDMKGATVCRFFKSLAQLHHLELGRFPFPADMTATDFALSIPTVEELTYCELFRFESVSSGSSLFQLLKSCRRLKDISICCTNPGPDKDWLNIPFQCNLRRLSLWNCDDLYYQTLLRICSVCPLLESLDVGDCPDITWEEIEAVKASCANLKFI